MEYTDIHAAKTLVEKAAADEPFEEKASNNRVGFQKGFISVPNDFDRLGSDEIADMSD